MTTPYRLNKRKACHCIPGSPSLKRPRTNPSVPPWPEPRPTEASSLNGLLRQHNRVRLYVSPLHWTSHHLELLELRFKKKKRNNSGGEGRNDGSHRPSIEMTTASRQLQCRSTTEFKTSVVRCLLQSLGLQSCKSDLPFFYDRRIVQTLNTNGVFSSSSSPSSAATPVLAYVDLATVQSCRDNSIIISKSKQLNSLITRLRRKAVQRLRPAKNWEDPYIAAVLIALAQGQRYTLQQEEGLPTASEVRGAESKTKDKWLMSLSTCRPPTPPSQTTGSTPPPEPEYCKVHLLAMFAQCLYLYTARISWTYLDRFNMPSRHFASDPVLINYSCIPINQPAQIINALNCVIPR